MDPRKELLIKSASRLYSLGVDVEAARARLANLVAQGVSFDSDEMANAYQEFQKLDRLWKDAEQLHLELRSEILNIEKI